MRKVEALPTPVQANSSMNIQKNPEKLPALTACGRKLITPSTAAIITTKLQNVTAAPPSLAEIQPPATRASAPTSGPRNAYCSGFTSGNWVLISNGKPAE